MDKVSRKAEPHSANPHDYQTLPQTLAVMPKRFPDGHIVAPHHHVRDQLIYAVSGVMRIGTADDAWMVPPDRALLMPAGVQHSVAMCGEVEMRTLYVAPAANARIKVIAVSALLRELIIALALEPMDFSGDRRAENIAALIAIELDRAAALPLNTPLPRDARLQRVCERLLNDPSIALSLEELADQTGASAKTLARLCTRELGMPFSAWRRRVRFSKALEMLSQHRPMKDVARRCGYESPSAFAFAFKREFGAPRSQFREVWPARPDNGR